MTTLQSENLFLRPLSFNELLYLHNNELGSLKIFIEAEALSDSIQSAISKKIEKMKHVSDKVHQWYTYWLIIDKASEKGIGFIGFKGLSNEDSYIEVGYSISPNYRKKGFMTEALKTLIDHTYTFKTFKGITAKKVLKTNIGSIKVLTNCNFSLIGSDEEKYTYLLDF
ncbi:GNAT family N-acetyltransferase [Clostridium manihotivorum]|uniref:N-acetyltransferase n=1 Tax=Clostridium manihotivorum TaxID=2320868 RepID=A0A410DSR1_9CLOT|nr:GNAT family N-acetyltransferase [Clostridium manihotivorum]QAA32109.1 N-acetyltransferase [Clostridium manihotivorum]